MSGLHARFCQDALVICDDRGRVLSLNLERGDHTRCAFDRSPRRAYPPPPFSK
jgi:hypothetical protein